MEGEVSGKVAAFAHYGVTLKNDQWSWSGLTPDGEVVLALWQDEFCYKDKPVSYSPNSDLLHLWKDRPGNRERISNLIHAREHRGGRFRVVVLKAVDTKVDPRKVEEAFPRPNMIMQLSELNEETGEFRAHLVEAEAPG
jgi:hypothetical protein